MIPTQNLSASKHDAQMPRYFSTYLNLRQRFEDVFEEDGMDAHGGQALLVTHQHQHFQMSVPTKKI